MKTTLPTIHTNGTGKQSLLTAYEDAYYAIGAARKALSAVEFNARDYYPQGPGAWESAIEQRQAQFRNLAEVEQYLTEHLVHISEAKGGAL